MVVLGGGAVSDERGAPVHRSLRGRGTRNCAERSRGWVRPRTKKPLRQLDPPNCPTQRTKQLSPPNFLHGPEQVLFQVWLDVGAISYFDRVNILAFVPDFFRWTLCCAGKNLFFNGAKSPFVLLRLSGTAQPKVSHNKASLPNVRAIRARSPEP